MKKQKNIKPAEKVGLNETAERRVEIFTGLILLAFGIYQSILYFGYTIVPNPDFPDLYRVGTDLLSFRPPVRYKQAPVLGLLQNFLYPIAWGPSRELTAGWLLNAILHPLNLLLLWLIGKKIIGKAAAWIALIIIINPWTVYLLTEPIIETTFLFFILLSFYLIFIQTRWAYIAAASASMVRYEGALLILAVFLMDVFHNRGKGQRLKAVIYALLASVPLGIWLLCTAMTWQAGASHYLSLLFTKEYSKGFAEPQENRTGILLNMKVLWQTGFSSLFTGASATTMDTIYKLSTAGVIVGFVLGCVFSIIKKQWRVWLLLLFFVPYFILHAFYPYPLSRFHATAAWIVMMIGLFGFISLWQATAGKWGMPKAFVLIIQIVLIVIAGFWLISIAPYMQQTSTISPKSAILPYAAMLTAGLIFAGRLYMEKLKFLPAGLTILAIMALIIASNQFTLVRVLGDGKKEIEFRQLGEWFTANAKPGEKMVVYNRGPAQLFAGKFAEDIVYYPQADNPRQLAAKLREEKVTYVTWATREGLSKQHADYLILGLDKNIAFLGKPRSIGCYEFVHQVGTERGIINIFRLKDTGDEQLPAQN